VKNLLGDLKVRLITSCRIWEYSLVRSTSLIRAPNSTLPLATVRVRFTLPAEAAVLSHPFSSPKRLYYELPRRERMQYEGQLKTRSDDIMRNLSATRNFVFKKTTLAETTVVALLVVLYFVWKSAYIAPQLIPVWDGCVYLLNAHDLLTGQQLYLWYYPLLMPAIIALLWSVTGENYLPIRFLSLTFTLATAVVLYYLTRSKFGRIPSFLAAVTYLTSIQILVWSDQLHVHGLTSLLATLAFVAWQKHTYSRSFAGGVFVALSVLARFASAAIALPVFMAFAVTNRKRPSLMAAAILGACMPILAYQLAFPFQLPHFLDIYLGTSSISPSPYYYYIANWCSFFGIIGVFGLVALFLPSTYRSDSSRIWAFWLVGCLVFFAITGHKEDRYTFEWTPAVVYLSFLCLIKIKDRLVTLYSRSKFRFLSGRYHGSYQRLTFSVILVFLVLFQAYTFGTAYIQYEGYTQAVAHQDNQLFVVAHYLKSHTPPNATFVTDTDAPALVYFSGRYGIQIWGRTSEIGYLDSLHSSMHSVGARYLIIFPRLTGNSIDVLKGSAFLKLVDTLNVADIGPVYVLELTS
jgi:hypothetical protein